MPDSPLTATVLITTKDRKQILPRAIDSVLRQTVAAELLVVDDGSTDGTAEFVRQRYPQAHVLRNEEPKGIIAARNEAAQVATGDILFTLDDDAEFRTDDVVESVLGDFSPPRVGVVAIPFQNHHPDGTSDPLRVVDWRGEADFPCQFYYGGGSNAMRRQVFLALDGYSGSGRQAEEPAYAIRLLDRGYVVRHASSAVVDHYPERDEQLRGYIMFSGARNTIKFAFEFVPLPMLLPHLMVTSTTRCRAAWKKRNLPSAVAGILRGCWDGVIHYGDRRAVSMRTYRLMRKLRNTPVPFSQVEPHLPPLVRRDEPTG